MFDNVTILLLIVVLLLLIQNKIDRKEGLTNENGNQVVKEKPTVEEVIAWFKQIRSSNRNLEHLNKLIKEKGYPNYEIKLRGFLQMIKLNIKNELTPDNIRHFI